MALASDIDGQTVSAHPGNARIAIAGDRTADFRRARRHSLLVSILRKTLPMLAIGVISFYGYTILRTTRFGEHLPEVKPPRIDPVNLTMDNPHYEGFNANGGKYMVTADTARQDLSQIGTYKLSGIKGRIIQPDASVTDLWAHSGTYDNGTSIMELFEKIEVSGSSGLKAHMTRATVQTKDSIVISKEPVLVEMASGTVRAKGMTLRQKSREITFAGDVQTHLLTPAKPQSATAPGGAQMFGASGGPMDIVSARLDVDDTNRTALFTGDVKAVQGDNALQAPELLVTYEGQATPASGAAPTPAPAATPAADTTAPLPGTKVKQITAKGPVLLTRGLTDQATSQLLEHDALTDVTVLSGSVVLTAQPDRRVTGDRAVLDAKADTVLLTGAAVDIFQGRNELHGRSLLIDRKTGRTHLTSPPERGHSSRIKARFYRSEAAPAAKAAAKAAPTDSGAALGAFKTDPTAPIDIDAERLDVDDKAKTATFHGDVHAVQGDFVIHTTDLVAFYTGSTGLGVDPKGDPKADPAGGGSQLTRIEARRKVVITSAKTGQKAVGDRAEFDLKHNTVILSGADVVLTQGQNVVKGSNLKIDMTTGECRIITNADVEGWSARAQPKGKPAEIVAPLPTQGRSRAIFYLPDKNGKGGGVKVEAVPPGAAAPAQAPDTASGWQARSAPAAGQATKSGD